MIIKIVIYELNLKFQNELGIKGFSLKKKKPKQMKYIFLLTDKPK